MFWLALYKDGSYLAQYDEQNNEYKYEDINRENLKEFCILDETNPVMVDGKPNAKLVLSILFERPTQKLIYRRRTWINSLNQTLGVVILAGWHEKVGEKSIKSICYIYEDGHIELAGARDDVELVPCEIGGN